MNIRGIMFKEQYIRQMEKGFFFKYLLTAKKLIDKTYSVL